MTNNFSALINCKTKKELTALCKKIEVNSQEFSEFIIECKMGLARLNHVMHYFDFVPEHLETREDDWGILDANEKTRKSSEGKKAIRRLFKSHSQRKYKVGHMFISKELMHPLSEWHFVFFEINEINNRDNHWVLGAHFHIVNYHWPNLYCQEIWSDFVQNKVFLLAAEKIRPKIAVVVLVLSQGGYPQPTRSGLSAEHGFGMVVGNRRRVLDGGDFFLKSILFVTF